MRSKILLGLSLLIQSLPGTAQTAPRIAAIDELVKPYIGKITPGLAVLVMDKGKILHMQGYGYADIDRRIPVTARTIFDLASVSKQMTALAAMMQIDEGLYQEETDIADLLPAFADQPGGERPLTVDDLIHHTSGLTDYLSGDETLAYGETTTNAEVVAWLATQELDHPPGTEFSYSNSGYLTLASLVAAADQASSLNKVLHRRIWHRLGMKATNLVTLAPGLAADDRALGYKGKKGRFQPSLEPTVTEGDGNVLTNLEDLARYERALVEGTLVDGATAKRLYTRGKLDDGSPVDDDGSSYGYGWFLMKSDGSRYAFHSGSWMGTSTYYQRNLTSGITIVLLANGEDMSHDTLVNDIEIATDDL